MTSYNCREAPVNTTFALRRASDYNTDTTYRTTSRTTIFRQYQADEAALYYICLSLPARQLETDYGHIPSEARQAFPTTLQPPPPKSNDHAQHDTPRNLRIATKSRSEK